MISIHYEYQDTAYIALSETAASAANVAATLRALPGYTGVYIAIATPKDIAIVEGYKSIDHGETDNSEA